MLSTIIQFLTPYRSLFRLKHHQSHSPKLSFCIFMTIIIASRSSGSSDSNTTNVTFLASERQSPLGHWATDPSKKDYVTANHEPYYNELCDYRLYVEFFTEVAASRGSATPYNKAVGKESTEHPHAKPGKPKILDPANLCIRTDAGKNIDLNQFDCLPSKTDVHQIDGLCGCGSRWSRIDLNDPKAYLGLNDTTHSYEYLSLRGLDKFLVLEKKDGEFACVADRFGHCTLDKNKKKVKNVTWCRTGYKCRQISIWSPVQKSPVMNNLTGEIYGLCISESSADSISDPFSGSNIKIPNSNLIFTNAIIIIIACCQNCLFFNDNPENKYGQNPQADSISKNK